MRQACLNRQYQLRKRRKKNDLLSTRSLARDRVLRTGRGAHLKSRRCRIVDDPDGHDEDDKQPERVLAEASQHRRRSRCRLRLATRGIRQHLTISVEFLGQHRGSGIIPMTIYVARPAVKTMVGTFNVRPGTKALSCLWPPKDGFDIPAPEVPFQTAILNMHGEIAVAETTTKDQQRVLLPPFDHDKAAIRSSARVTIATFWIA